MTMLGNPRRSNHFPSKIHTSEMKILSFTRLSLQTRKTSFIFETQMNIFFLLSTFFFSFFFSQTTQHNIQINKTKQQTHTQHLKVQSKGRERGKDNKNTKVTPLNNHVYSVKNTAKPQWLKAWPHRLAPLYIHMRQFAGGYGSNMPLYTCVV